MASFHSFYIRGMGKRALGSVILSESSPAATNNGSGSQPLARSVVAIKLATLPSVVTSGVVYPMVLMLSPRIMQWRLKIIQA
jgi:hypothetical protein